MFTLHVGRHTAPICWLGNTSTTACPAVNPVDKYCWLNNTPTAAPMPCNCRSALTLRATPQPREHPVPLAEQPFHCTIPTVTPTGAVLTLGADLQLQEHCPLLLAGQHLILLQRRAQRSPIHCSCRGSCCCGGHRQSEVQALVPICLGADDVILCFGVWGVPQALGHLHHTVAGLQAEQL